MQVTVKRQFDLGIQTVWIAAGMRDRSPVVSVYLDLSDDMPELASISTDYLMKTIQAANAFVVKATDDTARRGLQKILSEFGPFIAAVNASLVRSKQQSDVMGMKK